MFPPGRVAEGGHRYQFSGRRPPVLPAGTTVLGVGHPDDQSVRFELPKRGRQIRGRIFSDSPSMVSMAASSARSMPQVTAIPLKSDRQLVLLAQSARDS